MTCPHGREPHTCLFCRNRLELDAVKMAGRKSWEAARKPARIGPEPGERRVTREGGEVRIEAQDDPAVGRNPPSDEGPKIQRAAKPPRLPCAHPACAKPARPGEPTCFWHDPERIAEAQAKKARSRTAILKARAIREAETRRAARMTPRNSGRTLEKTGHNMTEKVQHPSLDEPSGSSKSPRSPVSSSKQWEPEPLPPFGAREDDGLPLAMILFLALERLAKTSPELVTVEEIGEAWKGAARRVLTGPVGPLLASLRG